MSGKVGMKQNASPAYLSGGKWVPDKLGIARWVPGAVDGIDPELTDSERELSPGRRRMKDGQKHPPTKRSVCGERRGYDRHLKDGEYACEPCKDAMAEHSRLRRERARESGSP